MNEQFTKDELITIKGILEAKGSCRKYRYTGEAWTEIEKEKNLYDKVSRLIVASEIGCTKEIVFDWEG
jgi:hypothetical protein